jgi:hypothetical protein
MIYHSPNTIVRNIEALEGRYRFVLLGNPFSIAKFEAPFFNGFQFWVVNKKGFLWEGFNDLAKAEAFVDDDENVKEALA